MTDYLEIENDEQFYYIKAQIQAIDKEINYQYDNIQKFVDEKIIANLQDYISRLKLKRTGLFNLCAIYTSKVEEKKDFDNYICRYGDSLIELAQAFYGKKEYWQYIYVYNQLTTDVLTPNQRIKIPKVHPSKELIYAGTLIDLLERVKI